MKSPMSRGGSASVQAQRRRTGAFCALRRKALQAASVRAAMTPEQRRVEEARLAMEIRDMLARVALIPAGVAPKDNADQDDLDRDTYNEEDLTTYQADLDRLAVAVDDEVPDLA